jgi:hypothetical protein
MNRTRRIYFSALQYPSQINPKIFTKNSQLLCSLIGAWGPIPGGGMATILFLDAIPYASGQAFDPETVEAMGIAYENICNSLNLVDRRGQLNELIARNIIELATCGVHDAERLSAGVLAIYKPAAE